MACDFRLTNIGVLQWEISNNLIHVVSSNCLNACDTFCYTGPVTLPIGTIIAYDSGAFPSGQCYLPLYIRYS